MKYQSITLLGPTVLLCAAVWAAPLAAQESSQRTRRDARQNQTGQLDNRAGAANVRVSQMIGMNIQNPQGESVGEISDLVIDARSRRIRYAAVTYGGFLGFGNKMFAVPYAAFTCRQDPNDKDEHIVVLDVTQRQLEGAEGFDEEHWPNFADRQFTDQLHKRYEVDTPRSTNNSDRPGRALGRLDDKTTASTIRASQLTGMSIQNPQAKDVGSVNDLVIDANTGRVKYAAVTYGGFLGFGDKMFAVPFEAFKVQNEENDSDEYVLVLDVTQRQLEGAKGFDEDHWPNFADRNFTRELDDRYGVERRNRNRERRTGAGAESNRDR